MKHKILGLLAMGLLAGPMAAYAVPITVSAGDTLIWNFDLSGQSVPPPYARGDFRTLISPRAGPDDDGVWSFFSDLDGGGDPFLLNFSLGLLGASGTHPEWTDGIWSVRLTMTAGSVSVDPCFEGFETLDRESRVTGCVPGTRVTAPVPEPGTLVLLGLGLLGLGLTRRRAN